MAEPSNEEQPEFSIEEFCAFLGNHTEIAAERARAKLGGDLSSETLDGFLNDRDCLRYPTEIRFDEAGLDPNQFAEPFYEERDGGTVCRLHVRPCYAQHPETLPLFVAYMAGLINYGEVVTGEICERYGAALVGMKPEAFYAALCLAVDAPGEDAASPEA